MDANTVGEPTPKGNESVQVLKKQNSLPLGRGQ